MEERSDLPRLTHYLSGTQLSDNVVESLLQVSQVQLLRVRREVTSVGFTEWTQSCAFIEEHRDYSDVNSSLFINKGTSSTQL